MNGLKYVSIPITFLDSLFSVESIYHPHLQTQIPTRMQRNCWMVVLKLKKDVHIEPITADFCINELRQCQCPNEEVNVQMSFHRKKQANNFEISDIKRTTSDQMDTDTPFVRHIVAMLEQPAAPLLNTHVPNRQIL